MRFGTRHARRPAKVYYANMTKDLQPLLPADAGTGERTVNCDTQEYDEGNNFNLTNDWFMAPRDGDYGITSAICNYYEGTDDANPGILIGPRSGR